MRRPLLVLGIVFGLAAVIGVFWAHRVLRENSDRHAAEEAHEALVEQTNDAIGKAAADLVTCLVGDDSSVAIERVALAEEMARSEGPSWPARCAEYAKAVAAASATAVDAGLEAGVEDAARVAAALELGELDGVTELVASLRARATGHASSVRRPARPVAGGVDVPPLLHPGWPHATLAGVDVVEGEVHLALLDAATSVACVIEANTFAMRCEGPREGSQTFSHAKGVRPLSRGMAGLLDPDGKMLVATDSGVLAAHAFAADRYSGLAVADSDYRLVIRSPRGTETKALPVFGGTIRQAGPIIAWKEAHQLTGPAQVKAMNLADGVVHGIGTVGRRTGDVAASYGGCWTTTHAFLDLSPVLVVHDEHDRYTVVPQEAQPSAASRELTCEGGRVHLVDVSRELLRVQDCDAHACRSDQATVDVGDGVTGGELGDDDLLLVWRKAHGILGARAPLHGFATAKEIVLATRAGDSKKSANPYVRVVRMGGGAVVFYADDDRLHAVGMKRDGSVVPITIVPKGDD